MSAAWPARQWSRGRHQPSPGACTTTRTRSGRHEEQAQYDAQQPQVVYAEAPPAAAPADDDMAEIQKLAQLHTQGILTDEEFAAKKKQILGI